MDEISTQDAALPALKPRLFRRPIVLVPLVLLSTTLIGGVLGPRLLAGTDAGNPALKEFADLLATTRLWYAEELPPEKLVYSSIEGMLSTLDPHTTFIEPEQYGVMREKQHGSFFGLGIIISKRNGKVTVITPVEGSPADRLGIRAGDIIDKIEGRPIDDLPVDAVVKKLKGPKGTTVTITIVRPGLGEPLQMTVTRAEIPTNSISHAFLLSPGVGYVRLKDFTRTSASELNEAWDKLEKQGMSKLVLDLRGNPGGLLDQAVAISDFFVKKGDTVVVTRGRKGTSEQVLSAPGKNMRPRIPVVVLINKGSASASEIVAGALQDHDRGLVVGQTSWGKGLVQSVYNLTDGAGLAVTSAKYYTPAGRCIQRDYKEVIEYYTADEEDESKEPETTANREVFRTDAGRVVYGGGGITPDVLVKAPTLSHFAASLYARGAFFEFAVDFRSRHTDIPRDFKITPQVRDEFYRFVDGRPSAPLAGTKSAVEAEKDPSVIDRAIREELMNAVYGREAGYRVSMEGDVQLSKALTLFPEAEKLAALADGKTQVAAK